MCHTIFVLPGIMVIGYCLYYQPSSAYKQSPMRGFKLNRKMSQVSGLDLQSSSRWLFLALARYTSRAVASAASYDTTCYNIYVSIGPEGPILNIRRRKWHTAEILRFEVAVRRLRGSPLGCLMPLEGWMVVRIEYVSNLTLCYVSRCRKARYRVATVP